MSVLINASTSGGVGITSDNSGIIQFQSAGANTVTIDASGNMGIGTASPTVRLQIGDGTVSTANKIIFGKTTASTEAFLPAIAQLSYNGDANDIAIGATSTSGTIRFFTGAATTSGSFATGSNAERMRIDSSGNVGIGTASGLSNNILLIGKNISGATNSSAVFLNGTVQSDVTSQAVAINSNINLAASVTSSQLVHFYAQPTSGGAGSTLTSHYGFITSDLGATGAATVTNAYGFYGSVASGSNRWNLYMAGTANNYIAGNVGIGTTSTATGRLNVSAPSGVGIYSETKGGVASPVYASVNFATSLSVAAIRAVKFDNNTTTSQVFVQFAVNADSANNGQINANGAGTAAFGSYSDERLKENIVDLPPQLSNISALRPVEFDYKDGSGHQIGFIAQEMQEVYPDVVGEQENGMLTITGWSKTEARLVKAIQELTSRIEALESK